MVLNVMCYFFLRHGVDNVVHNATGQQTEQVAEEQKRKEN